MTTLAALENSINLQTAPIGQINEIYGKLSAIKPFEVTAFGPSAPDEQDVVERRVSTNGRRLQHASSNFSQGKWLTRIAAYTAKKTADPIQVAELGTCAGISAMYLLTGMAAANGGHLTTFEGSSELATLSRKHIDDFIKSAQLGNVSYEVVVGSLDETLPGWIESARPRLDLAFIDGNHQEKATVEYHHLIKKHMQDNGIIAHDDIAWGSGMQRAWKNISQLESDSKIVEFYLGGKASRGLIFLGEPPQHPVEIIQTDNILGRTARRIKAALK